MTIPKPETIVEDERPIRNPMPETDYIDLARQLFEAADRECPNWRDRNLLATAMRRVELDLTFADMNCSATAPTTLDDLDMLKRALAAAHQN